MTLPTWYSTGTVSVEAESTTVTLTGGYWGDDNIMPGDHFCDPAQPLVPPQRVKNVSGNAELELWAPWPGDDIEDGAYEIRYVGIIERSTAQSRKVLEQLGDVSAYYDVQVDALANRDAYDARPTGYRVLVSDIGDGRAAIYSKASSVEGDWTDPAYFSGPVGPTPTIEIGSVTTGQPGTNADVEVTPTAGGVEVDFTIPAGEGFAFEGTYSGATAYAKGDVVRDNGSSWIALQATTDNAPPVYPTTSNDYWELLAVKGQDGTGTGDVAGPSGAVADHIAVFDGTTGKLLKDGGVTIDELQPEGAVRYDEGQSLSAGEKLQARENIYAASSMDWRPNIIVNGSMIDSQENGNALGTTNGYFAADQFALYFTAATAAMSIQRVQSSRSLAGSLNKLEFKTTTAKAVLAATDLVMISQPIEGSRPDFIAAGWGAAGAKPFMYRVDQQLPAGLYHIHAQNSAGNRHIAVPFTATGSEAVIEVVIPGDTAGTWLTGDGVIGVVIDIVLAAGSSRTGGTASTWSGSTFYAASTQKNILDSTANVAQITDVGQRLDPDATGVYGAYRVEEDAVYRSKRYVDVLTNGLAGFFNSTTALMAWDFSVRKAKNTYTATLATGGVLAGNGATGLAVTSITPQNKNVDSVSFDLVSSGLSAGAYNWRNGYIFLNSRLS